MHENEIAAMVVDAAYQLHRMYGPGLLETAYRNALAFDLRELGLDCRTEVLVPMFHRNRELGTAYRADLIIENLVIVEVKATEHISPVHQRQVLTYLRLTGLRLGLLVNFGGETIKEGLSRVVNNLR